MDKVVSTRTYNDLCKEIDILDIRISSLEREKEQLKRMMFANAPKMPSAVDYAREKVTSGFVAMPLDEIVERMHEIDLSLEPLYEMMNTKEKAKREIEEKISEFEGLDYKVAYLRLQGRSLIEIADELGYSHDWIKKVSSRIGKGTFKALTEQEK